VGIRNVLSTGRSRRLVTAFVGTAMTLSGIGLAVAPIAGATPTPTDHTIALHNDSAEVSQDCPDDGAAYWHFVLTPNNGSFTFTEIVLKLDGSTHSFTGSAIVPNGGQKDNVFVAVPSGHTLTSLEKDGSYAHYLGSSAAGNFNLSHVCAGETTPTHQVTVEKEWTGLVGLEGLSAIVTLRDGDNELGSFVSPTHDSTTITVLDGTDVTVDEQVFVPDGCQNQRLEDSEVTDEGGHVFITVHNEVSCLKTVDVTVIKQWDLKGGVPDGISADVQIGYHNNCVQACDVALLAAPADLTDLPVTFHSTAPTEASTTVTVAAGSTLDISEQLNLPENLPEGCRVSSSLGENQSMVLELSDQSTSVTILNTVICPVPRATLLSKSWSNPNGGLDLAAARAVISIINKTTGATIASFNTTPLAPSSTAFTLEDGTGFTIGELDLVLPALSGFTSCGLSERTGFGDFIASTSVSVLTVGNVVTCTPFVPPPPPPPPPCTDCNTTPQVTPVYDLGITKTVNVGTVAAGAAVSYTLTVTAAANSANLTNVVVTDVVPAELENVTVTGPAGWTCGVVAQTVTCTKPTFAVDEKAVFTVKATVKTTVTNGAVINNVGTVKATETEITLANNTAAASVSTVVAQVTVQSLPPTGGNLRLVGVAMLMLGLGALALLFGRRRRLTI
jgi:uncharacterized repeat protein (TIGR01451 family)